MNAQQARAALVLVPTEAHVETALATPHASAVRSLRGHQRDAMGWLAPGWRIASSAAIGLATLDVVRAEPALWGLPLPGTEGAPPEATWQSLAAHVDRAGGAWRRSKQATPDAPWAARVAEAIDRRLLPQRWVDARGLGAWLASFLGDARAAALRAIGAQGSILLRGVVPWTADDLAWIEALHRASRRSGGEGVTVALRAGRAPEPLAAAVERVPALLERRWSALDDAPEIRWEEEEQQESEREDGDPPSPARAAAIVSARTAEAEARAVVAAAREAIARGAPPEAAAIVVPDLRPETLAPLGAALREARAPHALPAAPPLAACPDARAGLALVALAEGPLTRDLLLDVLRAPGVHPGRWVEAADEREAARRADRLCHRLRQVPVEVDPTGALFVEALEALVEGKAGDAWMPRAVARLAESVRPLGEAETWSEAARRFEALAASVRLGEPSARDLAQALDAEAKGAGSLGIVALGEGTSAGRALRAFVREGAGAAEAMGLGSPRPLVPAFRAWLADAAQREGGGAGGSAARAAALRIGLPEDLAGLPLAFVAITGLCEGAYGAEAGAFESAETAGDRATTAAGAAADDETAAGAVRRAPALAALLGGRHALLLSHTTGDERVRLAPHPLIAWAAHAGAEARREPASRLHPASARASARADALCKIALAAPLFWGSGSQDGKIALAAPLFWGSGSQDGGPRRKPAALTPDLAERVRIELARRAFFLDPRLPAGEHTGKVALLPGVSERLHALVGGAAPETPIAVTAVEKAAGCAFVGFARRVLRLQRASDVAESGDARERGTLVHRALHAAFVAASEGGAGVDLWTAIERGRAAAERALRVSATTSPLRREALMQAIRDALAVLTRAWLDSSGLRFRWGEQPFGPRAPAPWAVLALTPGDGAEEAGGDPKPHLAPEDAPADAPATTVFVEGTIDRIDATHDLRMLRVVDYKTGRLPEGDEARIALQLPLYAEAARRAAAAASGREPEGVHAVYVRIAARGVVEEYPKRDEDRAGIAARFPAAAAIARGAVTALREGHVAPRPMFLSLCAKCEARDVCRRPAVMPIEDFEDRGR